MSTLPLPMCPWIEQRFLKVTEDGLVPNAGGLVYFFVNGDPTTPQNTYTDSDGTIAHAHPIELDVDGRPPSPIYLLPTGYTVEVQDSDEEVLYTVEFVEDVGSAFLDQQGTIQTEGTEATSSPYIVAVTDNLVRVNGATDPFVVQLPAASTRGTQLIVKNLSAADVDVTPTGAETIEGIAAAYTVAAGTSPVFPTITLLSDGISNWWIASAMGV